MPNHSKQFRFASPPFSVCRFFSMPLLISSLQFRCFSNPDGSSPFQCRATQNHAKPSQFASLLFRVQLIVSRHKANQCRCISVLRFAVSSPVLSPHRVASPHLAIALHFHSHLCPRRACPNFAIACQIHAMPTQYTSTPHLAVTVRFNACLCYGLTFRLLAFPLRN